MSLHAGWTLSLTRWPTPMGHAGGGHPRITGCWNLLVQWAKRTMANERIGTGREMLAVVQQHFNGRRTQGKVATKKQENTPYFTNVDALSVDAP